MKPNSIPTANGTSARVPATTKTAEIAVILDRSGSMEAIATDAIGGFNVFVATRPAASRPDTIIVAILTDGEENASRTFSQARIAFSRLSDRVSEKRAK